MRTLQTALNFSGLVVPQGDGGLLIDPPPSDLPALLEHNRRILDHARAMVMRRPLAEVRTETRRAMLGDSERPVWVVGHQPAFIHPGVWFKHVVADRLARATGGRAVNVIVDDDVPKRTSLRAVRREGDDLIVSDVAVPTAVGQRPYEQWSALSGRQIRAFGEWVREAMGGSFDESLMPAILRAFGQADEEGGYVSQGVAGRRVVDAVAGVALVEHRISACWGGPLLGHIILDADRFADAYNAALAWYRGERRIAGRARPIPDLHHDGGRTELPLWTFGPAEPRRRLWVARRGDRFEFYGDDELLAELSRDEIERWCEGAASRLPGTECAVRPRALVLTMWARLVLGDLFVHGIGGAKYDRVTNRLIESYFGIEPPAMACASATLRLPLGIELVGESTVRQGQQRLRDWAYNPQRYQPESAEWRGLCEERSAAVERSRRLKRDEPDNHDARREVFDTIRRLNERMHLAAPEVEAGLRRSVDEARQRLRRARIAASREYFVGLFPAAKLQDLTARLDGMVDR